MRTGHYTKPALKTRYLCGYSLPAVVILLSGHKAHLRRLPRQTKNILANLSAFLIAD